MNWPTWWGWELELSSHLEKRMLQRGFGEIDLRTMLEQAIAYRPMREHYLEITYRKGKPLADDGGPDQRRFAQP